MMHALRSTADFINTMERELSLSLGDIFMLKLQPHSFPWLLHYEI